MQNYNPYVLVLIDADGCHVSSSPPGSLYSHFTVTDPPLYAVQFKPEFINKGIDGGKKAAYALRSAILTACHSHAGEIEVIARVIANLSGLSKAMRRDGSLANESTLKDFTLGFTQGMASFDFIDVGDGKERTYTKIKGKSPERQTRKRNEGRKKKKEGRKEGERRKEKKNISNMMLSLGNTQKL